MIGKILAFAAAASVAATPCFAAEPALADEPGERRSGASAGVYLAIPFGGSRSGRPQGGLRLQMTHDYRSATGRTARAVSADALELRLIGEERPTLFVADRPVTGREARQNLMGEGIIGIAVLALAVVGAIVIYRELKDDEDDNCLDPELCD